MVKVVFLAAVIVAGCAGDDFVVETGKLSYDSYYRTPMIAMPESVAVGEPFTVDVSTDGGGCIKAESTELTATDDEADITPYDRRRIPGEHEACDLILVYLHHTVSLSFASPGTKTIQFHVEVPQAQSYVPGVVPMQLIVQ